jgi:hypothetical protein
MVKKSKFFSLKISRKHDAHKVDMNKVDKITLILIKIQLLSSKLVQNSVFEFKIDSKFNF